MKTRIAVYHSNQDAFPCWGAVKIKNENFWEVLFMKRSMKMVLAAGLTLTIALNGAVTSFAANLAAKVLLLTPKLRE